MADDKNTQQPKVSTVEPGASAPNTTQSFLDIDQIREGVVILRDGGMRMVLMCSAINFELKSELEQQGTINAFQSFINSLDIPIQITVQSRQLDLTNYLRTLEDRVTKETNELLRRQIVDYIAYISDLILQANIMEKRFYVVVPHYPGGFRELGFISKIFGGATQGNIDIKDFDRERLNIAQKASIVASGLQSCGIKVVQLDTQELIELYYATYNTDQASTQKLIDISQAETEIIRRLPDEFEPK